MKAALALLLLLVGTASAQYRFPPVYDDYATGSAKATRAGTPLVTFVGCQPFEVQGAVACMTLYLPEYPAQCIVLSKDGVYKNQFPMGTSCEVICKEVAALAVNPFQRVITITAPPVQRFTSGGC